MSGNLVKLAQRFVRLSGELHATRDAMRRLLLNGGRVAERNPTTARRPSAKRPQSGRSHEKAVACGYEPRLCKAETVAARQSGSIGSVIPAGRAVLASAIFPFAARDDSQRIIR
jgi:hypothetical protein